MAASWDDVVTMAAGAWRTGGPFVWVEASPGTTGVAWATEDTLEATAFSQVYAMGIIGLPVAVF